jgi:hypothetical protein
LATQGWTRTGNRQHPECIPGLIVILQNTLGFF